VAPTTAGNAVPTVVPTAVPTILIHYTLCTSRKSSVSSTANGASGSWKTVGDLVVPPPCAIFGVFDGHGGDITSTKLSERLHTHLLQQPDLQADPPTAMERAFHR
jgi:hypothetical protein